MATEVNLNSLETVFFLFCFVLDALMDHPTQVVQSPFGSFTSHRRSQIDRKRLDFFYQLHQIEFNVVKTNFKSLYIQNNSCEVSMGTRKFKMQLSCLLQGSNKRTMSNKRIGRKNSQNFKRMVWNKRIGKTSLPNCFL